MAAAQISLALPTLLQEQCRAGGRHSDAEADDAKVPHGPSFWHTVLQGERALRQESTHDIPESSYGAAMAMLVQAQAHNDWNVHMIAVVVYAIALLPIFAEFFILMTTMQYVTEPSVVRARELYHQYHRDVFEEGIFSLSAFEDWDQRRELCELPLANREFCFAILAIWTGFVMIDLKDTCWLAYLWAALKRPADNSAAERSLADWDEDMQKYVIKRAPCLTKGLVFLTIILPKFIIAIACWWLGARWLISTANFSDLILNSVALAFIIEIDDMVFRCMMPMDTQEWVLMHCITRPARLQASVGAAPLLDGSPTGGDR
mmetsp:Transcript_98208/g.253980  ORF Transcript_98208/g.253980 Transcript_98208/m.253980 type:complete len:318 (-) Transcript_98208:809-1762(-)